MPMFFSEHQNTNTNNMLVSNMLNLGDPSEDVDSIYIVGKNIATANLTGGIISTLDIPSVHYDGNIYLYKESLTRLTGDVILNITGTNVEITKVYLMKKLFEFLDDDTFIRLDMGRRERNAIIHEDLYGDYSKVKGSKKRRVAYTAERQDFRKYQEFELFDENNTHFIFSEWDSTTMTELDSGATLNRDIMPERMYNAILSEEISARYSTENRADGVDVDFVITER